MIQALGKTATLNIDLRRSGTYYINAAGSDDDTGTYTLSVQTFADSGDDFQANEFTTSVVTVGGSVTGEIERSGDEDWHAVSLLAGETYVIDLKGADGDWGTLADPIFSTSTTRQDRLSAEHMTLTLVLEKTATVEFQT